MAPATGKNLWHLLSKLPQNGLGARVAPVPWALKGWPNAYYHLTYTSLRWVAKTDGAGFPLKVSSSLPDYDPSAPTKLVPADENYVKAKLAALTARAEELRRATRAGEKVEEQDIWNRLDTARELDALVVGSTGTVLRPAAGQAHGVLFWNGKESEKWGPVSQRLRRHLLKVPWREIRDDETIKVAELKALIPTPRKKGPRRRR